MKLSIDAAKSAFATLSDENKADIIKEFMKEISPSAVESVKNFFYEKFPIDMTFDYVLIDTGFQLKEEPDSKFAASYHYNMSYYQGYSFGEFILWIDDHGNVCDTVQLKLDGDNPRLCKHEDVDQLTIQLKKLNLHGGLIQLHHFFVRDDEDHIRRKFDNLSTYGKIGNVLDAFYYAVRNRCSNHGNRMLIDDHGEMQIFSIVVNGENKRLLHVKVSAPQVP